MDKVSEIIIFETDNIRITNKKANIGLKSYEIADIVSVTLREKNRSLTTGKALVIISLICLVIGILSCLAALSTRFIIMVGDFINRPRIILHFLVAVVGLLFIYVGSLGLELDKPTYLAQLETISGTAKILEDKDKTYVERIINAINDAIARRRNEI